jgi:hypothetical protein
MLQLDRFTKALRTVGSLSAAERKAAAAAFALAPAVEGALVLVGFERTLRWIELVTERRGAHESASRAGRAVTVERLSWIVDGVYRWHFLHGECLPRALLQYGIHRHAGTPVRFVLGVRRPAATTGGPSIEAHAWVEAVDPAAKTPTDESNEFARLIGR